MQNWVRASFATAEVHARGRKFLNTIVDRGVVRAGGGAGSIYDPALASFVLPIAAIALIGLIATLLPARRAAAIDPVELLRAD